MPYFIEEINALFSECTFLQNYSYKEKSLINLKKQKQILINFINKLKKYYVELFTVHIL